MLKPIRLDGVLLDHAWIATHIPHCGRMCLLSSVLAWDAQHIVCATSSHRDATNPLRQFGRLGTGCGIEYAAQAMAVHSALLMGETNDPVVRPGLLLSVRRTQLHVSRLDDIVSDLQVHAERTSGNGELLLYEFSVCADGRTLLDGRASILIDALTSGFS
ncbi:MAG: 3-hydroxylacyl-ACP dehydratase [Chromatiales bacterium 21-64-14]|nr:MAG: 3-hydroxylacyl-ACP dehydratase [Chromatiales bacterium 21-64-14]HQU14647.1 3-hydroxylacyl-ACP dehydratase [Gammaproteobacteria bacterium]